MIELNTFDQILAKYPHATTFQRWHMRGRLRLCPYDALLKYISGQNNLLDIGCGFGHFAWYLQLKHPGLQYFGCDIDKRKINLANNCSLNGTPAQFFFGDILQLPKEQIETLPQTFDHIVILDVLYLLPWAKQVQMIKWCLEKLSPKPESSLIIKTMDFAKGWIGFRTILEEWIMVHLLKRTRSSGTINGIKPFNDYIEMIQNLGWKCTIENLPTWNPSSIIKINRNIK